jgi:PAS domain S-box-containing protein
MEASAVDDLFELLEKAADGVFVIDGNQRIVFWNATAERMLGYTPAEVMGRSCYEIIRGRDDDDKAWCRGNCHVILQARAGDSPETFDTCARTKSGEWRWINVSILAANENGDAPSPLVVHLFRDATQQKQRERFAQQVLGAAQSLQASPLTMGDQPSEENDHANLTPRELEVLALLAQGLSTQVIAQSLSVSRSTTRNHIQNIFQKLGVHSRAAAVAYAFESGLVANP